MISSEMKAQLKVGKGRPNAEIIPIIMGNNSRYLIVVSLTT